MDSRLCVRGYQAWADGPYQAQYFNDGMETVELTQDDIDHLEDLHDEEILSVDELVGGFLGRLDPALLARTLVVIFSDHGEMFAKHGRFGRGGAERGTLYDEVVHIPLLMKIPDQPGRVVKGLVQLIDVMPTLLAALDIPDPLRRQGKNLLPLVTGAQDEVNSYVYAGSFFGGPEGSRAWRIYPARTMSESVRSHAWKLIHEVRLAGDIGDAETYELYHLTEDPNELHDLVRQRPLVAVRLQEMLEEWKWQAGNFDVSPAPFSHVSLQAR